MKKDIEWLKKEVNELPLRFLGFSMLKQREEFTVSKDDVLELINQLDEPEVLSKEWIDENEEQEEMYGSYGVPVHKLKNLLVPKQEEADQAYKDGYDKGKQHATEKQTEETETVAGVLADYLIASAKLKRALSTEVEEMEE